MPVVLLSQDDTVSPRSQPQESLQPLKRTPSPLQLPVAHQATHVKLHLPSPSPPSSSPSKANGHAPDATDKGEVEEGAYLKSKLWWLGMILIAIGEGGNFLSYGFAPASVVAPLGTVVSRSSFS